MSDIHQLKEPKKKTKAKARYLKAKKERRKQRRVEYQDNVDVTYSNEIESGAPAEALDLEKAENITIEERPRKRRKVDQSLDSDDETIADENTHGVSVSTGQPPRPSTPQTALPSFPLPTRPDAPSKLELALLGMDKALVDAEVVESTKSSTIQLECQESDSGLSEKTRRRLAELGITELFAVQTALIPFLLKSNQYVDRLYVPYHTPRDVCVSAPTGSGKTLAYVLPIIEILSSRIVTRLRALVVLPTRDLVSQIGFITGQHSFAHEQLQLIADHSTMIHGGSSKVDILICTPGRLIDHLNGTPNFSLQHLRFLIVDEADKLLAQSFQGWLPQVLAAIRPQPQSDMSSTGIRMESIPLPQPDATAPGVSKSFWGLPTVHTDFDEHKESSCQKLLFSATLTRDPAKLAALELRDPQYFVVQGKPSNDASLQLVTENFSMPATLTEYMIVCESSRKPLMLFHLVHSNGVNNALVFTKSAESTTRLVQLFEFFEESIASNTTGALKAIKVRAYSSDLAPSERKSILDKFRAQEIDILVCSDLISRGIDISHVSHVVSYDVPVDIRKYIHRVGRTARAGRDGTAWTLVEEQEARHFKSMIKGAKHSGRLKRLRISEDKIHPMLLSYETALGRLKDLYLRAS